MSVTIIQGDALTELRKLADCSVNCCVTSPPYWALRDYGVDGQIGLEKSPEEYVARLVEVFREVRRILRDDGTLWLNLGASYAGGGRGCDTPKQRSNRGTNGMPDSIIPLGYKPKDMVPIPWLVAMALQADGWWLRSEIIWHKPNPMPESVTDRPTKSHEHIFLLAKSARYFYDAEAIKEPLSESSKKRLSQPSFDEQTGGPKDYGHRTNANRSARKALCNLKEKFVAAEKSGDRHEGCEQRDPGLGRNKRDVWWIAAEPYKESHFAVFPRKLVEPCILAGCPAQVCPKCGAPWERMVEKNNPPNDGTTNSAYPEGMAANRLAMKRQAARERGEEFVNRVRTLGFRPTCECKVFVPKPDIPQPVLDMARRLRDTRHHEL